MLGGGYLCYEGAEKILEWIFPHKAHQHEEEIGLATTDTAELEKQRVASAIRTDFILSAEIMAITLSAVPESNFWTQAAVLAAVGISITVVVYGAVALIVKADDFGVLLGQSKLKSFLGSIVRGIGQAIVAGMPTFLKILAAVGTIAMLWVGGSIITHGLAELGWHLPENLVKMLSQSIGSSDSTLGAVIQWLIGAASFGVFGLAIGAATIPLVQYLIAPISRLIKNRSPKHQ